MGHLKICHEPAVSVICASQLWKTHDRKSSCVTKVDEARFPNQSWTVNRWIR